MNLGVNFFIIIRKYFHIHINININKPNTIEDLVVGVLTVLTVLFSTSLLLIAATTGLELHPDAAWSNNTPYLSAKIKLATLPKSPLHLPVEFEKNHFVSRWI